MTDIDKYVIIARDEDDTAVFGPFENQSQAMGWARAAASGILPGEELVLDGATLRPKDPLVPNSWELHEVYEPAYPKFVDLPASVQLQLLQNTSWGRKALEEVEQIYDANADA